MVTTLQALLEAASCRQSHNPIRNRVGELLSLEVKSKDLIFKDVKKLKFGCFYIYFIKFFILYGISPLGE